MEDFHHIPVLLSEVLTGLSLGPGDTYVDCTLGGAGHAQAVLNQIGEEGLLVGIDRDPQALKAAQERLGSRSRVVLVHSNYTDLDRILTEVDCGPVDGVLFDLGVSSHQLDTGERGFSYHEDALLDMRMNPTDPLSAYTVVNEYSQAELAKVIWEFGEERWAKRVAQFIVQAREQQPIATTGDLVAVIKQAIPAAARQGGPHPARRTFQALRIEVNGELTGIEPSIRAAVKHLRVGGRVCVISFHSLEDRIVKRTFQDLAKGCVCPKEFPVCVCGGEPVIRLVNRKPITAGRVELDTNPRSRSAKLRVAEKLSSSTGERG